ncbi:S-adenosyl-L-methionine-dependent methyltransferase [Aspergillus recurvatus]
MSETPEIYPLARDEAESRRLNEQHKLLVDFVEGPIDRSVPLENITTVADVATGTGIWLWDARRLLVDRAGDSPRYFHGFDISPAQFPPAPEGIEFTVQDIFKPFSVEHHNRYDLVNVRLLVTAFPESEFEKAVKNLLTILKPGGYLHWVEIDFSAVATDNPRAAQVTGAWLKFCGLNKLSLCGPEAIHKAYQSAGLLNIVNRPFLPRNREDLLERQQKWQLQFYASVMPLVLLKTGQVADNAAASKRVSELLRDLELFYAEGNIVDTRLNVLVGQKPT